MILLHNTGKGADVWINMLYRQLQLRTQWLVIEHDLEYYAHQRETQVSAFHHKRAESVIL